MASSTKLISFFLIFLALSSVQIHARDSQFFSKVTAATTTTTVPSTAATTTTVNNNKDVKETTTVLPNKQEQEQEPNFIPETQNAYGLYGNEESTTTESSQFPTTTKLGNAQYAPYYTTATGYVPHKTQTQAYTTQTYPVENRNPNANFNTNNNNNNNNYYYDNNNNQRHINNGYEEEEEEDNFGETSLQERSYSTMANRNNNYNYNYNGANNQFNGAEKQGRSDTSYYSYNGASDQFNGAKKQGMSDTRYLENGKYYYDTKNERNTYPNQYHQSAMNSNNYGTRGYYSNNNNHENTYEYNNSNERFQQNQENFQESREEKYWP